MAAKRKRVRRRPEEAQRLILDAAEAGITALGPASLRLQDVAQAVGLSHSTILHHFGSREGLVQAVNRRTLDDLKTAVIEQMARSNGNGIRLTFAAYRDGLAQRVMWLLQSPLAPSAGQLAIFNEIVAVLHQARVRHRGWDTADISDTRTVVHLITVAAFGDAVIGARMRQAAGPEERVTRERFETWFCELIERHVRGD